MTSQPSPQTVPHARNAHQDTDPSRLRWSLLALLLALAACLFWASQSELEQVTRAPGKVIAASRTQVIQAPDGGVVEKVLVREGQRVAKGTLLVQLDDTKARAAVEESLSKSAALRAAIARLRAETFGTVLRFDADLAEHSTFVDNQRQLYARRQTALQADLRVLTESARLAAEEVRMNEPLARAGDISTVEFLRLQRGANEAQGQLSARRNKYLQDAQAELTKAEEDLASVQQLLNDRQAVLAHTRLLAPVDGVINLITLTTQGAVLRPGDEILQLLPTGEALVLEARIRAADIGFVRPGMKAAVKLDAYDYSIYGVLDGEVVYISSDALNERTPQGQDLPYYRTQVRIDAHRFKGEKSKAIEVQPGMTATVEIITGANTVLGYLLKPVKKTVSEALGER